MLGRPVGADLELVALDRCHAELLIELVHRNRDYLRPWHSWVDRARSVEDADQFIVDARMKFSRGRAAQFAIRREGTVVGFIGLDEIDREGQGTTISYWLDQGHQGKGFMTRACVGVLNYAFVDLGLNRAEIRCDSENLRSRRLPERLKFRQEGVLRQAQFLNGSFRDVVLYGMLAAEWREVQRTEIVFSGDLTQRPS
jgi:ribosomal-protein-serine acetyltransferase